MISFSRVSGFHSDQSRPIGSSSSLVAGVERIPPSHSPPSHSPPSHSPPSQNLPVHRSCGWFAGPARRGACGRAAYVHAVILCVACGLVASALPTSGMAQRLLDRERRENPFDGEAAFEFLKQLCEIGPRITGTQGMIEQQELLIARFEECGAEVSKQSFTVKHPVTGRDTEVTNLIARWFPEKEKRILFAAHYDTRPFPDRDPKNPTGKFVGANDGASGCALFWEMARHLGELDGFYGIDLVLFDAEEFVYERPRDPMFVGSTHFAEQYKAGAMEGSYVCGILVDMIADKHLEIYWEKNSRRFCQVTCDSIWQVARELGIREFRPEARHQINDDHIPLNEIAKIPTIDIIDFDYPTKNRPKAFWHTMQDIPENCSADSLAKVGWVLIEWIKLAQKQEPR